jgi:hypothetical protein
LHCTNFFGQLALSFLKKGQLKAGAFDHSAISASKLRRGLFKKVYINLLGNPRKIFDFSGLEKCLFF